VKDDERLRPASPGRWMPAGFDAWVAEAPDTLEHARRKQLGEKACGVADDVRDGKLRQEEAAIVLRALCPGFDDATYSDAMGYGFFLTR
jgi:hypothetical protein